MSERIDHVVINVEQQLDAAAAQYTRLGFALTPRGHHSKGSSNYLAIFGDDYLELLGVEAQNARIVGARLGHPPGLAGLVLKTSDADQRWTALRNRAVPLEGSGPQAFHRPVAVDGVELGHARFRTLRIGAGEIPNGRVFFCEHGTPELVWRAQWQHHPNGASALAEYVYVTPDPQASVTWLTRAFGSDDITHHPHGIRFQAGPVSVWYLTPAGVAAHYAIASTSVPQEIERAIGLTLKVSDLSVTLAVLRANEVPLLQAGSNRIVVHPEAAQGVLLAFI